MISDSIRDQVLRHGPNTGVFSAAYRDEFIRFNIQDAYLEENISDNGLTRAFIYISIRCNPGVPKDIPEKIIKPLFITDPDIINLEYRAKELYTEIK